MQYGSALCTTYPYNSQTILCPPLKFPISIYFPQGMQLGLAKLVKFFLRICYTTHVKRRAINVSMALGSSQWIHKNGPNV